jgi:hypothetical protein
VGCCIFEKSTTEKTTEKEETHIGSLAGRARPRTALRARNGRLRSVSGTKEIRTSLAGAVEAVFASELLASGLVLEALRCRKLSVGLEVLGEGTAATRSGVVRFFLRREEEKFAKAVGAGAVAAREEVIGAEVLSVAADDAIGGGS